MFTPTVDRGLFRLAMELLEKANPKLNVAEICRLHGLADPRGYSEPRVPISMTSQVVEVIGESIEDPLLLYRVMASLNPEMLGTLFYILKFCETAWDALRMLCRYSTIASDVVQFSVMDRKAEKFLVITPCHDAYVSVYQIEAIVFGLHGQAHRAIATGMIEAPQETSLFKAVYLRHAPLADEDQYRDCLGCPVYFGHTFNGLLLNQAVLNSSLCQADARMEVYFRTLAERYEVDMCAQDSLTRRVQRLFIKRMGCGDPDRQEIAQALALSVRSMQRQLATEGTSYREAIDAARLMVAKQELATAERNLDDIALLLGCSEERAFRRAFQRWEGMTPAEYRVQHAASS